MKKVLSVVFLVSIMIYACSTDSEQTTANSETDNLVFSEKGGAYAPGDQIAVWNPSTSSWQFSVSASSLLTHLEDEWRDEGETYDLTTLSIDVHTDAYGTSYALIGKNTANTVKVGTIIEYIPASASQPQPVLVFNRILAAFNAGCSCTSTQCPYSCNPGQIYNPNTGKYILGCTSCPNTCTKTTKV